MIFILLQLIQYSLSGKNKIIFPETQNSVFSELFKIANHFSYIYETGTLTAYPNHPRFTPYSASLHISKEFEVFHSYLLSTISNLLYNGKNQ